MSEPAPRKTSMWQIIKEQWQAESKKAAEPAPRTESEGKMSKSVQCGIAIFFATLFLFGFHRYVQNWNNAITEIREQKVVHPEGQIQVQARAQAAKSESYEQGLKAGQEQLQKNYDVGGGLPLPGGQAWWAKNAVKVIQPQDEKAFIEGYVYAMKKVWENTTGWKESNFQNITPGAIKPGILLYGYGMTEPLCEVVKADSQRMLVKYFNNGSVEWKNLKATASQFFQTR